MLVSQVNYTSMVANIRNTSKVMTRLTLGIFVSFIGAVLTLPSSAPIYPAQNSLPRLLQGQIFFFTLNAFTLGIVFQIITYMQFGSRKQSYSQTKGIGQNLSSESRSKSDSSQLQHNINSPPSDPGSSGSWNSEDKSKRRAERVRFASQPELSEHTKNLHDPRTKPPLPSAGAQPFVPIILATLRPPPNSSRHSSHQSAFQKAQRSLSNKNSDDATLHEGCCVRGTAVMDMGGWGSQRRRLQICG